MAGDLNPKVGLDTYEHWVGVVGKFGLGWTNEKEKKDRSNQQESKASHWQTPYTYIINREECRGHHRVEEYKIKLIICWCQGNMNQALTKPRPESFFEQIWAVTTTWYS